MSTIIGIDEVGRGCWAGPLLVVAARQIAELPTGLKDSKKLTKLQREKFFDHIVATCELGEGWVTVQEVDDLGLTQAMYLAVKRALTALEARSEETIIMDGNINYCPRYFTNSQAVVDADALHPIVSAASVYAKVLRDTYMAKQSLQYPHYAFEKHVGYGTASHIAALKQYGVCELHRRSYKPIQAFLS